MDKKPRSYYVDFSKRNKGRPYSRRGMSNYESDNARYKLVPEFDTGGNRGFIITAIDEVKSYLEMRNLLEGYFHEVYDESKAQANGAKDRLELTTEDELEAELKHLRVSRPFKQVKTHCRNAIFLNILDAFHYVDPIVLTDKFFNDLYEKRTIMTKNTCKVLPVLDTFRNNVSSAKESIIKILNNNYATESEKNYFIEIQTRGNYKLEGEDKQKLVEGVAEAVHEAKPDWRVRRENADYIICLTALRDVCCLSILKDYFKRNKYNVMEFCKMFVPDVEGEIQDKSEEATVRKDDE